jgi:hypothetical protein
MMRSAAFVPPAIGAVVATLLCASGAAAQAAAGAARDLRTRPETTGYRETSRYDDVTALLGAVTRSRAGSARRMRVTPLGYSSEGRMLPLVVVGNVADATPEAVRRSGLLRVYVQGNIHAGEVEGKEAALLLLRSLAAGAHARWFDSLVLLVAPIYNADGNERIALTNRPLQNGPVGGMGQRPNAQGFDLNRDHMKLETPEARAFAAMLTAYDPQVTIDLHTTNGSVHAYLLTYAPPLHPGTDPAITRLLREVWLPEVTRAVKQRDGWDFFYYGNLPSSNVDRGSGGSEMGWYSFDHRPRFNNNYVGLRNRFAILSEAYSYATFEDRIRATLRFVEETVGFAHRRAGEIRRIVESADGRALAGDTLPLRGRLRRGEAPLDILIGAVAEDTHPFTGQRMLRRLDYRRVQSMADYSTFQGVEFERVPRAYFVPAALTAVINRLEAHGVRFGRTGEALAVAVERFRIDSTRQAERPFQNHRERTVVGAYETARVTVPAGTVVVPTAQPLGRLVFYLLEPRSDDGLLNWNLLDEALERAPGEYPILRTFSELPGVPR